MKGTLAAVAVALLLVGTGAAMAMPGNAPDDVPADDHIDDRADDDANESDDVDDVNESDVDDANESDEAETDRRRGPPSDVPAHGGQGASADDARGPPADMPEQVPEFVGGVHDAVRDHVAGSLVGVDLGERISSLTPDDSEDTGNASDAPGTPAPAGADGNQ